MTEFMHAFVVFTHPTFAFLVAAFMVNGVGWRRDAARRATYWQAEAERLAQLLLT